MAETSWEAQTRRRNRFWKWLLIILLIILVAGIIIYNNRDVISGRAGLHQDGEVNESFSLAADGATGTEAERESLSGKHDTAQSANLNSSTTPVPPAGRVVTEPAPLQVKKLETPVVSSSPSAHTRAIEDSVEIGEVPCIVANRNDIIVRIALVVYCDKAKKSEVLFKRDALAVVTRNAIRTRDLESIRFDELEPELISAMNIVFDIQTITGIAVRSVKIEKVLNE